MKKIILKSLIGACAACAAYAASTYSAIDSGNWGTDIWNDGAGGSVVVPGNRPTDAAYFLVSGAGKTVTLNAGTVTLGVASSGAGNGSTIAAGATLNISDGADLYSRSTIFVFGTLNVYTNSSLSIIGAGSTAYLTVGSGIVNLNGGTIISNRNIYIRAAGGQININSGLMQMNNSFYGVRIAAAGGTGTFSITGGTLSVKGSTTYLTGQTEADLGTGVFNQTGGLFQMTNAAACVVFSNAAVTGRGIYNLSGGELMIVPTISYALNNSYAAGISLGANTSSIAGQDSQFNWTGGRLSVSVINMSLVNNGGDFNPTANDGSISTTMLYSYMREHSGTTSASSTAVSGLNYTQKATGRMTIDVKGTGAGEHDVVYWRTLEDKSNWDLLGTGTAYAEASANFEDGTSIYLNLMDGYVLQDGDIFDIFYSDSITLAGSLNVYVDDVLSGDFTVSIEQVLDAVKGDYDILRLTYNIPEPSAAAALLGLLAIAAGARRRK